ncbi:DUF4232 domain-containing protein [Streptomyces sp. NPDC001941]|uniref:DUF4232 domain-containing protein n=1 Tax=Streptomyces sp. NPDC001941 TaxID=3154659 RepID=UPI003318D0B0
MRVHKLTLAALAVTAGLALTACQNGDDATGAGQGSPSSAASSSSTGGAAQSGGKDSSGSGTSGTDSAGKGSGGQGATGGSASGGSDASGASGAGGKGGQGGKCRTGDLAISAVERTIDGDKEGTVVVEFKNKSGKDCTLTGYAGVDLKTNAGNVSAARTGQKGDTSVLKSGKSTWFGISYPFNKTGGSGVRITGLLVTPPNETNTVTLAWPGGASLPVTEGGGAQVKVGPIGSAGQGG